MRMWDWLFGKRTSVRVRTPLKNPSSRDSFEGPPIRTPRFAVVPVMTS